VAGIILFDLNGTLTDPKPGITRCIRYALERMSLFSPPEDELTWCIGPPLRGSLAKLVGDDAADRALELFRERFDDVGLYENDLYPGIPELLEGLAGRRLFLATSKPSPYAQRILEHFWIKHFFEGIFGSELDGTRADKSDLIGYLLEQTDIARDNAVMVGDRSHDMVGARRNGVDGLGVTYGYGSEDELREAGAKSIYATVADLRRGLLEAS
jgi:phosphoglycolate phosphatase